MPGTPERQAPFGPCSQALFTTVTLTSESNTFSFTPCTCAEQQFNLERQSDFMQQFGGLCQIKVPPNYNVISHG